MPDKAVPESSYPPLERPSFKSQIPPHLMGDASPSEQYMLEQLNVLAQTAHWSIDAHISTMESVRKTNGRLIRAEEEIAQLKDDKKSFISGWRAIVAVTGFLMGAVSFIAMLWGLFFGGGSGH